MNRLKLCLILGQMFCLLNAQEKSPTEQLLFYVQYGDNGFNFIKEAIEKGADVNFRAGHQWVKHYITYKNIIEEEINFQGGVTPLEILIKIALCQYPIEKSLRLLLSSGAKFDFIYETNNKDLINYVEKIYLEELDKMVQERLPVSDLVKMVHGYLYK